MRALNAAKLPCDEPEEILTVVRRVLRHPGLTDLEEGALAGRAEGMQEALDRFTRLRVERALEAGLKAGAGRAGDASTIVRPRVALRRFEEPTPEEVVIAAEVEGLVSGRELRPAAAAPDADGPESAGDSPGLLLTDAAGVQLLAGTRKGGATGLETCLLPDAYRELVPALRRALPNATVVEDVPVLDVDSIPVVEPQPLDEIDDAAVVGSVFDGKYRIVSLIGVGGFGAVYEGRDLQLDCPVAIKVLRRTVTGDADDLAAFKDEARKVTRLKHPNIVDWKALNVTESGECYFVMEKLEGEDLESVLEREGPLPPRRAARILLQMLDALRAAHFLSDSETILHLDLKPSNVFLESAPGGGSGDWVKVIDFGISQYIVCDEPVKARMKAPGDACGSSRGTTIRGESGDVDDPLFDLAGTDRAECCTPEYAAPEHGAHLLLDERALPLDERADLYSLGVVGFQMLTGELPFPRFARYKDLLRAKLTQDPPKVAALNKKVPRRLAAFIDRCLERDRNNRWRNTREAYDDLHRVVHPSLSRRLRLWGPVIAVVVAALTWTIAPRGASPTLDLYSGIPEAEKRLGDSPLHLGPVRPSVSLRVAGAHVRGTERVRVVRDRDAAASGVPGWSIAAEGDNRIRLHGPGRPGRVQDAVYLQVTGADDRPLYSRPLELVWLGDRAVRLESVEVPGRRGRAVDPRSQRLEILVAATPGDIAEVEVRDRGRKFLAREAASVADGERLTYTLDLEPLALEDGAHDLEVRSTDRAGGVKVGRLALEIVSGPLTMTGLKLSGARFGSLYLLAPGRETEMDFALSRKADVVWTVHDESEAVWATGRLSDASAGPVRLDGFSRGRSFAGRVELVADDNRHVLRAHPDERGRVTGRLDFLYSDEMPEISVYFSRGDGDLGKELEPGERFLSREPGVIVDVVRQNALPLALSLAARRAGASDEVITEPRVDLSSRSENAQRFNLRLPGDGCFVVAVRCWRLHHGGGVERPADLTVERQVVIDSSPPTLELGGALDGAVILSRQDSSVDLTARVQDEVGEGCGGSTPVDVWWEILGAGGERLARGDPRAMTTSETAAFALDLVAGARLADGTYRLALRGRDAAGNEAVADEATFEVALDGPSIHVIQPAPDAPWSPDPSGRFAVQVACDDPNGVRRVALVIRTGTAKSLALDLEAGPGTRGEGLGVWRGLVRMPPGWADAVIDLDFEAEDTHGRRSAVSKRRQAGSVLPGLPRRVAVYRQGLELGAMRLVPGNRGAPYVFGGRADATEEQLFRAAGLGVYNRLRVSKSWRVVYDAGEIEDYYLDEGEVTVSDYLVFVLAADGFANPAHWPGGARPDPGRREELAGLLHGQEGALPVTGVTWEEAAAYASWVGKRLPSYVEWEYALRGGVQYRPHAAYPELRGPDREMTNVGAGDSGTPWPAIGAGGDRTPDTGLWNLSGNVAEWTATPAPRGGGDDAGGPASHAASNKLLYLRPGRQRGDLRDEYWAVGASWRDSSPDFSTADYRRRRWSGAWVGFRCASDTDGVLDRLNSPREEGPFFKETTK